MSEVPCPCTEALTDSKIRVEENGKKAVFLNIGRARCLRVHVDGCLIKQATACDWLVVMGDEGAVLVELKGKDVEHALVQLETTMEHIVASKKYPNRVAALVVCGGVPKHPSFDTKLQRAKSRLVARFKAPLHVVHGNFEYEIGAVLSFKGPHKIK